MKLVLKDMKEKGEGENKVVVRARRETPLTAPSCSIPRPEEGVAPDEIFLIQGRQIQRHHVQGGIELRKEPEPGNEDKVPFSGNR